jgi:hypothetical protein
VTACPAFRARPLPFAYDQRRRDGFGAQCVLEAGHPGRHRGTWPSYDGAPVGVEWDDEPASAGLPWWFWPVAVVVIVAILVAAFVAHIAFVRWAAG